nr:MAG TPA: hypothetical protein [Caudoviricetes sp.]
MDKEKIEKKEEIKTTESKYSKEQLLKSKKYSNRKDLLGVLLDDKKEYTFAEVDAEIDKFMKRGVK